MDDFDSNQVNALEDIKQKIKKGQQIFRIQTIRPFVEWYDEIMAESHAKTQEINKLINANRTQRDNLDRLAALHRGAENHIGELMDVLLEIRDLARTGLPPAMIYDRQAKWDAHRIDKIAGMANAALAAAKEK